MSRWIDAMMLWLKWPVAAWVVLSIPRLIRADLALITGSVSATTAPFWLGLLGYRVVWWGLLRRRGWGRFLPTLLHELTHGLFAVLTFHRIVSLRATWSQGGEIQYVGRGNWLISIAPYFFPLALLLCVPLLSLLETGAAEKLALIGVVFGFEGVAMWRQVHRGQSDLQRVGFVFTALFLPGALLWTYGMVLVLVLQGEAEMLGFLHEQWEAHWDWLVASARILLGHLR